MDRESLKETEKDWQTTHQAKSLCNNLPHELKAIIKFSFTILEELYKYSREKRFLALNEFLEDQE